MSSNHPEEAPRGPLTATIKMSDGTRIIVDNYVGHDATSTLEVFTSDLPDGFAALTVHPVEWHSIEVTA